MEPAIHTAVKMCGAALFSIAFACLIILRMGCEVTVAACSDAVGACAPAPCAEHDEDNADENAATCYLCSSHCCSFLEFSADPITATMVVSAAAVAPSAEGPRLTYPPLLPPPRVRVMS